MKAIPTALWYRTGKVSLTQNSPIVNGTSTNFAGIGILPGDLFIIEELSVFGEVKSVNSDTELELYTPYSGVSIKNHDYAIIRNFNRYTQSNVAENVSKLIDRYERYMDGDVLRLRGKSAYETAKELDPTIEDEEEWIRSLKGKDFTYNQFTQEQLNALKGEKGEKGETGPKGDRGDPFQIARVINSVEELSTRDFTDLAAGSLVIVSTDVTNPDNGKVYVWSGNGFTFLIDLATHEVIEGPQGEPGPQGPKGDKGDKGNAFKYEDFTSDQLEDLRGPRGAKGATGETGPRGQAGADGKSAYESYLESALANGTPIGQLLSETNWVKSLSGKSAYEIALEKNPDIGTEEDWLLSLKGKSAYDIAKEVDPTIGTQEKWVNSMIKYPANDNVPYVIYNGTLVPLDDFLEP